MTDPYLIAFASLRSINRRLAEGILSRTGDEATFFTLPESKLSAIMGCSNRLFDSDYRAELMQRARNEARFIDENRIHTLYFRNSDYPSRLTECDDAPLMLYTLGECDINASHMISIVGTRHATPYGIDFVTRLIDDLAAKLDSPPVIVSGLAYGIDIAAHRAAMNAGLPTVAVLAHGLNTIYPAAHRNAAAEIVHKGGMLVTDYMSKSVMHKGNFVARNRIVAGLSDCLVVAESAEKGGALITAGIAAAYNRDVMALPGRTSDKYSRGCNRLIASNVAALIDGADALIEAMQWKSKPTEGTQEELPVTMSPDEQSIADYLTANGEGCINEMCVTLGIPISRLMTTLIDMEFKGIIITYPGGKYRLS